MQRGQWVDPAGGRILLEEWAATFLRTTPEIAESTRATYARDLRRYVLPHFGALPLARIRPGDIRVWLADELAAGIAPSSVHRHFRTLRRVLNVAVESELLVRSPCATVKPPALEHEEMRFLSAGEVHALAESITPSFRALVLTAAYGGLRWGELIGLRRAEVDLEERAISVVEQLGAVEGMWIRKAPKTKAGRRRVTVPAFLAEDARDHLAVHSAHGDDGLVFPNRAGNPSAVVELQLQPLDAGQAPRRARRCALPRPAPHRGGAGHRPGRSPQGDPGPHGSQQRAGHARPLRAPVPRARRGDRRRPRSHLPRRRCGSSAAVSMTQR